MSKDQNIYKINDWDYLDRFLVIGTENSTYYASSQKLTKDAAKNVIKLLATDGIRVVNRVVEMSDSGRCPKNDYALFTLALATTADNVKVRAAAMDALPKVARTGTHLFTFVEFVDNLRGWGRGLRKGIANWYTEKEANDLAYQLVKYQQRNGWSHRDVLRLCHASTDNAELDSLFRWTIGGMDALTSTEITRRIGNTNVITSRDDRVANLPEYIHAFEALKKASTENEVVSLIEKYRFPHEAVPNDFMKSLKVWEALAENMPITATIRNLPTMTRVGLFQSTEWTKRIADKLNNERVLKKGRVHPVTLLNAMRTYTEGKSLRGSNTWNAVPAISHALEEAFYTSFGSIEPTNKKIMIGIDCSASMTWQNIAGINGINPREAAAVMAMVAVRTEPNANVFGFSSGRSYGHNSSLEDLKLTPKTKINDVITKITNVYAGSTDCSLPMGTALSKGLDYDAFFVYTDSETNCNSKPPMTVLKDYNQKVGKASKLVVVGMTATDISIADSKSGIAMDVVGFDSAAPQIMSDFIKK